MAIEKKVVTLQPEMVETVLSLGRDAERKVRAAQATMLPNGKASEGQPTDDSKRHRKHTAAQLITKLLRGKGENAG